MTTLPKEYLKEYFSSDQYKLFHEYKPTTHTERLVVTRPPFKEELEEKKQTTTQLQQFAKQKAKSSQSKDFSNLRDSNAVSKTSSTNTNSNATKEEDSLKIDNSLQQNNDLTKTQETPNEPLSKVEPIETNNYSHEDKVPASLSSESVSTTPDVEIPRYSGPNLTDSSQTHVNLSDSLSSTTLAPASTDSTPESTNLIPSQKQEVPVIHPGVPNEENTTESLHSNSDRNAEIFNAINESLKTKEWLQKVQEVHIATAQEIDNLPLKQIKLKSTIDNRDSYMPLNSTLFNILSCVILDKNGLITFMFRNGGNKPQTISIIPEKWAETNKENLVIKKLNYYYQSDTDLEKLTSCFKKLSAHITSTDTYIQYFIKYVPIIFE